MKTKYITGKIGSVLGSALIVGALTGGVYAQPSVQVGASVTVAAPTVEIHAESDFYEPLTPHGRWVVVGGYGRCWVPAHVAVEWRPYCDGYWTYTDCGWYWVSTEPWAWATYHYGCWDFDAHFGWFWVPRTVWAPAWVSWHCGGGYIGWAPLYPRARVVSGAVSVDVSLISPRAFVFVEERHFMQPVSRSTVVVNNTTIINKTVTTSPKVVNNTVINEGPSTATIEKASGRKVQLASVQQIRHRDETAVVAKQPAVAAIRDKNVASARNDVSGRDKSTLAPRETPKDGKAAETPKHPESKPEVKPSDRREPPSRPDMKPSDRREPPSKSDVKPPGGREPSPPSKPDFQPSDRRDPPPSNGRSAPDRGGKGRDKRGK